MTRRDQGRARGRWAACGAAVLLAGAELAMAGQVPAGGGGHAAPNRAFWGQDLFVPVGQQIGNATCVFCSVQVEGEARGRVLVLFGNLSVTGRVDGSATVVGGNAVFDGQSRVQGNTTVVAGNAVYENEEVVLGNVLVLGGHSSTYAAREGLRRRLALSPPVVTTLVLLGCLLVGAAVLLPGRRRRVVRGM